MNQRRRDGRYRDPELLKLVENYLISNCNKTYVDIEDMVSSLQSRSYRFSRMKKQVFVGLVKDAYYAYCNQNNVYDEDDTNNIHIPGSKSKTGKDPIDISIIASDISDSDIEIEEQPQATINTQITGMYQSKPGPSTAQGNPQSPKKVFRKKVSLVNEGSTSSTASGTSIIDTPIPEVGELKDGKDRSEDDLEIIEVSGSILRNNSVTSNGGSKPLPVIPQISTLKPIIKNVTPLKKQESVNGMRTPTAATASIGNKILKNSNDSISEFSKLQSRGLKRKTVGFEDDSSNDVSHESKRNKKDMVKVLKSTTTFADFGGSDKVIEEICRLLMHLKHPEIYKTLGVTPPRGFILHGPPGCGKTLLANAIAGELKLPMLKMAATELISGISGESENNIRQLFDQALGLAPCVIFIDEIDSITPKREIAQREMEKRIVAQLLACIDDLTDKEKGDQVLLIGATNRIESIDTALRRAGRFDREICLGIPDFQAREKIIRVLSQKLRLSPDFNISTLAKLTPGYVGADIQALLREAAVESVNSILSPEPETKLHAKTISTAGEIDSKTATVAEELEENMTSVAEEIEENMASVAELIEEKMTSTTREEEEMITSITGEEAEIISTAGEVDSKVTCLTAEKMEVDNENIGEDVNGSEKFNSNEKTETDAAEPSEDEKLNSDEKTESDAAVPSEENTSMKTLENVDNSPLRFLRDVSPITESELDELFIQMKDFEKALKRVQPSSKREGFATVPDTTWDDIGALKEIRDELQVSILGPVKYFSAFQALGLNTPAGVLLCGPPGCGKTLLAKAVANEAGINFISVKGPELLNMYVGESERAVRQCFLRAKNSSPCVIFFDELDALCPRRSEGPETGSTSRVVNQLLTEMDGMESRVGVFVMAATNRPDIIDPAILRPGRLDKVLFVNLPSPNDRVDILKTITKSGSRPIIGEDVNLETIGMGEKCTSYTGADLAALVREASIASFRELVLEAGLKEEAICKDEDLKVYQRHFDVAFTKTKPSISKKDQEKYEQMKTTYSSLI